VCRKSPIRAAQKCPVFACSPVYLYNSGSPGPHRHRWSGP
jgi:hypothetical protein